MKALYTSVLDSHVTEIQIFNLFFYIYNQIDPEKRKENSTYTYRILSFKIITFNESVEHVTSPQIYSIFNLFI